MTEKKDQPEQGSDFLMNPFGLLTTTGEVEVIKGGAPKDPAKESKESK